MDRQEMVPDLVEGVREWKFVCGGDGDRGHI